jgi:hypothetical protein
MHIIAAPEFKKLANLGHNAQPCTSRYPHQAARRAKSSGAEVVHRTTQRSQETFEAAEEASRVSRR